MIEINGYKFDGGGSCPEQYDVYKDDKYVAYVRFRWGSCTVRTEPGFDADIICDYCNFDMWQGNFDSEKQRMYYLRLIAKQIEKFYQPKRPKRKYVRKTKKIFDDEKTKEIFESLFNFILETNSINIPNIQIKRCMYNRWRELGKHKIYTLENNVINTNKLNKYKDYRKYKKLEKKNESKL